MQITIYMAVSVDGFIAGPDNETPWSDAEWDNYNQYLGQNDVLVVGRTTHELMRDYDEYERLGNPQVIVVSSSLECEEGVEVVKTPEQAIELASSKGFTSMLVGGGTQLNSTFLEQGLAQKLHLDIEPVALKSGISLFNQADGFHKFKLIQQEALSSGCISVDYEILQQET